MDKKLKEALEIINGIPTMSNERRNRLRILVKELASTPPVTTHKFVTSSPHSIQQESKSIPEAPHNYSGVED